MPLPLLAVIAISIGLFVLGEILRPKPKLDSQKPASFEDFNFPTADETRPIQWFCGSVEMEGPNLIWTGDFHAEPIMQKVRTGLFSTQKRVRFYQYHVGMDFAFGYGPGVKLRGILTDDLKLWEGDASGGQTIHVAAYDILGGNDAEGGIAALAEFYDGDAPQGKSAYLEGQVGGHLPNYNGLAHLVWRGWSDPDSNINTRGYVGNSKYLRTFKFRLFREIDGLGQSATAIVNGNEANPAEAIYELITTYSYALGIPTPLVDIASFQAAAQTLYDEGMGLSTIFDNQRPVGELIEEILSTIGGIIYRDYQTQKYVLKLIRGDYDLEDLDTFTSSDIARIEDYSRSTYSETTNEVRVPFINIADDYKNSAALAQDLANIRSQGGVVPATINFIGVGNSDTASALALRELTLRSIPLARMTLVFNRRAFSLKPGDVFILQYDDPDLTISQMVVRVGEIDTGSIQQDGVIKVKVVEDIFAIEHTTFFTPPVESTQPGPSGDGDARAATQIDTALIQEQPYATGADNEAQLWTMAARPDDAQLSYDTLASTGGDYQTVEDRTPFTPTATINGAIDLQTVDTLTSLVLTVEGGIEDETLLDASAADIANGENLFQIDNEIFAFETASLTGDQLTLGNVWRALLDTTPAAHSSGARAWFFSYGSGIHEDADYSSSSSVDVKLLSRTSSSLADDGAATVNALTIRRRALRPIAPADIAIDGDNPPDEIPATGDVVVTWKHRNRLTQDKVIKQSATVSVSPESGTTYTVKVYDEAGTLQRTTAGITDTTFTYTNAMETADCGSLQDWLMFEIYSVRDGLTSWQRQIRKVKRPAVVSSPPATPSYTPSGSHAQTSLAGTYEPVCAITLNPDGTVAAVDTASCTPDDGVPGVYAPVSVLVGSDPQIVFNDQNEVLLVFIDLP
jgi:hypothetical protein